MVSSTLFYQFKVEFQEKKSFNRRMLRKTRLILKHSRIVLAAKKQLPVRRTRILLRNGNAIWSNY